MSSHRQKQLTQGELFADPVGLLEETATINVPASLWERLARSAFKSRLHLNKQDRAYLERKTLARILEEGMLFINKRLAPAHPIKDGKQTPWKGHPIFVAQHATGNCCRSCLYKWHKIPKGVALTEHQKRYMLTVMRLWLKAEQERPRRSKTFKLKK